MKTQATVNDFFIAAYEAGAEQTPVPTWAAKTENPFGLERTFGKTVQRVEVQSVPGAFQLLHLLTCDECRRFIETSERLGYTEDASVSLPRSVRRNENLVWVADDTTHDIIWQRCKTLLHDSTDLFNGKQPLGLNRRFRFYKYAEGDFFKPHTDGSWPGSRMVGSRLVADAYGDRFSRMSFLILLNEAFTGGATVFYVDKNDPAEKSQDVKIAAVRTPAGGALCFPHGQHPLHCLHSSETVLTGVKYIIRTDLLFAK
jgi:predicted 2-oxoglutarate/Fe(II)-dependent dioxygenase YbiX